MLKEQPFHRHKIMNQEWQHIGSPYMEIYICSITVYRAEFQGQQDYTDKIYPGTSVQVPKRAVQLINPWQPGDEPPDSTERCPRRAAIILLKRWKGLKRGGQNVRTAALGGCKCSFGPLLFIEFISCFSEHAELNRTSRFPKPCPTLSRPVKSWATHHEKRGGGGGGGGRNGFCGSLNAFRLNI